MAITMKPDDALYEAAAHDDVMKENNALTLYMRLRLVALPASNSKLFCRAGARAIEFVINSDGTLRFDMSATTALDRYSTTTVAAGNEYVLICTWDGSLTATNIHMYINGTEVSYGTTTDGAGAGDTSAGIVYLGNRVAMDRGTDGIFREAAIFNQVIGAGSIAALSTTTSRNVPLGIGGCLRYWRMDDAASGSANGANTIADSSRSNYPLSGDDGADNADCTWLAETILSYDVTSTTGEHLPTSVTTSSTGVHADDDWVACAALLTQGDGTANAMVISATTFDAGDQSYVIKATNFDFSEIVAGSTIKGVVCRFKGWANTSGATAVSCGLDYAYLLDTSRVEAGENIMSLSAAMGATAWLSGTTQIVCVGLSSNMWSNALTADWVKNANFGVALGFIAQTANTDVFLDYVTLEIVYVPPAAVTPLSLKYTFVEC
jgi:hypothetical protein